MIVTGSGKKVCLPYHRIVTQGLLTGLISQSELVVQCILCLVKLISYIFIVKFSIDMILLERSHTTRMKHVLDSRDLLLLYIHIIISP